MNMLAHLVIPLCLHSKRLRHIDTLSGYLSNLELVDAVLVSVVANLHKTRAMLGLHTLLCVGVYALGGPTCEAAVKSTNVLLWLHQRIGCTNGGTLQSFHAILGQSTLCV